MGRMDKKICLDTDVSIAIINGEERVINLLNGLHNLEVYITSITAFELLLREKRLDVAKRFVEKAKTIPFRNIDAIKSSAIFKDLKEQGTIIDFRDIFIASICISDDCPLATFNKKHFKRIKGLKLVDF
jgi:tRNA(fMet)-specific endonuclease VapC